MKKNIVRIFFLMGSIIVCAGLIEAGVRIFTGNDLSDLQKKTGTERVCLWDEYVYPHPNLGYAVKDNPDCKIRASNLGTIGEDLPWVKAPDEFVILMLGGSVAQEITSTIHPLIVNWPEKHMRRLFRVAGNKKIRIISGANIGWKQPSQLFQLLGAIDRIDAFMSLEGYNEARTGRLSPEIPGFPFFVLFEFPDIHPWKIQLVHKLTVWVRWGKVLKHSLAVNRALLGFQHL